MDRLPLEPRAQLCLRWRSPQDAPTSSRLALDTEGSVTALHLMLRALSTYPDFNFVNSPLVKSSLKQCNLKPPRVCCRDPDF